MKFCPEVFAEIFYPLFASILLTCVYPEIWKVAYVRPLHKEGPRNVISNYRPISLLPKISLIFERIIFLFFVHYSTRKTSSSAVWVSVKKELSSSADRFY